MDSLVKDTSEIQLNTNNFNTDSGFILSQALYSVTNVLIKKQDQAEKPTDYPPHSCLTTNHEPRVRVGKCIMSTNAQGIWFP